MVEGGGGVKRAAATCAEAVAGGASAGPPPELGCEAGEPSKRPRLSLGDDLAARARVVQSEDLDARVGPSEDLTTVNKLGGVSLQDALKHLFEQQKQQQQALGEQQRGGEEGAACPP